MRSGLYHQKDHLPDRFMRWRKLPAEGVRSDSPAALKAATRMETLSSPPAKPDRQIQMDPDG
jgi:hypothetical protein